MRRTGRRPLMVVAIVVVLGVAASGIAYATIPNGGVINACYTRSGGSLRVVDETTTKCKSGETSLAWNVAGPQGTQGLQGPQGSQGPQGVPGPAGVSGWQIVSRAVTVASDDYVAFGELLNVLACPSGKKAVGGGVVSDSSTTQGPRVVYSGPSADGTHWLARVNNTSAFEVVITGSVICASVGS